MQFSPSWSSFSNKKIVTLFQSLLITLACCPKELYNFYTPETFPGISDILSIRRGACSSISLKFGLYLCLIQPLSVCEAVLNEKSFLKGNLHTSIWSAFVGALLGMVVSLWHHYQLQAWPDFWLLTTRQILSLRDLEWNCNWGIVIVS